MTDEDVSDVIEERLKEFLHLSADREQQIKETSTVERTCLDKPSNSDGAVNLNIGIVLVHNHVVSRSDHVPCYCVSVSGKPEFSDSDKRVFGFVGGCSTSGHCVGAVISRRGADVVEAVGIVLVVVGGLTRFDIKVVQLLHVGFDAPTELLY